jgi:hypothetical protein
MSGHDQPAGTLLNRKGPDTIGWMQKAPQTVSERAGRDRNAHLQWERSCSMRMDGKTDMKRLIVVYRNFAKASRSQPVNVV